MKKKCTVEERREESRLLFDLQMLLLMEISIDGRYALINYDGRRSTNRNWILLIFKTWDSSIHPISVEFVNVRTVSQWMIEKLRTEIGLSPLRSLWDSLNRAGQRGEKRGMDVRSVLSYEVARFLRYIPPQLLFSCHLPSFSSLFTLHDEWPFPPSFFSMCLRHFASLFPAKSCRLRLPQMYF